MKKWAAPILVIGAALFVLMFRASSSALLKDSDTAVLLDTIRAKNDPWLWFKGDWPLFNHFYRPISTLVFEFDNHFYRDWAPGYGWTNAILAAICVSLVGWLATEITGKAWMGAANAVLFSLWLTIGTFWAWNWVGYAGLAVMVVGLVRDWKRPLGYLTAGLALWYFADEMTGQEPLWFRTIGWIPGRTATTMTVFCLVSLAAYARWERNSPNAPAPPEPTPLTPPATRSTRVKAAKVSGTGWLLLSLTAAVMAFGSYEQAVMLPACLLGIGIAYRMQRYPGRRGWISFHVASWMILGGYLVLRHLLLPEKTSGYQEQQLRYGGGVWFSIAAYFYPFTSQFPAIKNDMEAGWLLLLTATPLNYLNAFLKPLAAAYVVHRDWILPALTFCLSIVAFLPMAFLQQFEHYHFWPMALRAIFVVSLMPLIARAAISAVSPRGESAPKRLNPAPGSLPRP